MARSLKSALNKYRSKLERMYEDLVALKEEALELSEQEEENVDLDDESSETLSGLTAHLDKLEHPLQEAIEHLGGEV